MKKLLALAALAGSLQATPPAGYVEQKLTPNDATGTAVWFGRSVAITPAGKNLVAGSPFDNNKMGAVTPFKYQTDGWHQDGHKLVGSNAIGTSYQGNSVTVSANGNRIATGGTGDNDHMGAVWVYDRPDENSPFSETAKLVAANVNGTQIYQGTSVKFNDDGTILAVGCSGDSADRGAVIMYKYNGTNWEEVDRLIGSGAIGQAMQGSSVDVSSNGDTIVVGAPDDENQKGGVYVFQRIAGTNTWKQQGPKLRCGDATEDQLEQGLSVSISGDGNTIAFGIPDDNKGGSICVFNRMSSQWIQQGSKLQATTPAGETEQPAGLGYSVALSKNSKILLAGAPGTNTGAAYLFRQNEDSKWAQEGTKIVGSNYDTLPMQGTRVALSDQGTTLAVAGNHNNNIGALWTYNKPEEAIEKPSTDYYYRYWIPGVVAIFASLAWYVMKYHLDKFKCMDSAFEYCCPCCLAEPSSTFVKIGDPTIEIK